MYIYSIEKCIYPKYNYIPLTKTSRLQWKVLHRYTHPTLKISFPGSASEFIYLLTDGPLDIYRLPPVSTKTVRLQCSLLSQCSSSSSSPLSRKKVSGRRALSVANGRVPSRNNFHGLLELERGRAFDDRRAFPWRGNEPCVIACVPSKLASQSKWLNDCLGTGLIAPFSCARRDSSLLIWGIYNWEIRARVCVYQVILCIGAWRIDG